MLTRLAKTLAAARFALWRRLVSARLGRGGLPGRALRALEGADGGREEAAR